VGLVGWPVLSLKRDLRFSSSRYFSLSHQKTFKLLKFISSLDLNAREKLFQEYSVGLPVGGRLGVGVERVLMDEEK